MNNLAKCTVFALLPAVCFGGDVKAFSPKDVDYTRYKTYRWLPSKGLTKSGIVEGDDVVAPMIAKSVKAQLAKKGLTEVDNGADLSVVTWGLSESVPQIEALVFIPYTGVDLGTYWGTNPITTIGRYNRQGSLIVNLIDERTNKSVWAGMATRALGKAAQLDRDIGKAASDLFKKYPVKNK